MPTHKDAELNYSTKYLETWPLISLITKTTTITKISMKAAVDINTLWSFS